MLKTIALGDVRRYAAASRQLEPAVMARAANIVDEVRRGGWDALQRWAAELDGKPHARLLWGPADFAQAWAATPATTRALLQRTAERIRTFAELQRASLQGVAMDQAGPVHGTEGIAQCDPDAACLRDTQWPFGGEDLFEIAAVDEVYPHAGVARVSTMAVDGQDSPMTHPSQTPSLSAGG